MKSLIMFLSAAALTASALAGPFVVGNWYKTDGGRWVKMAGIANKGETL